MGAAPAPESRPAKIDLRPWCSPVENQLNIGSCTGNAIVGALEYLQNRARGSFVDLSRLFVYYLEREMMGKINEDSGAYLRDGIKCVITHGVASETVWPYHPERFRERPSDEAFADAANHKFTEYLRITSFDDLRHALAMELPVVFGFLLFDSFMSADVAVTGRMPMPQPGENHQGGHAVLCVGYDDEAGHIIVRNSWGNGWGDQGYFYMPYEFVQNPDFCQDFWAVKK